MSVDVAIWIRRRYLLRTRSRDEEALGLVKLSSIPLVSVATGPDAGTNGEGLARLFVQFALGGLFERFPGVEPTAGGEPEVMAVGMPSAH